MSSMFQNLGNVRRGMVRPQANAPQEGLGNPAEGQEDQMAPMGGSNFLPQGGGAPQQGGPPQAQLGAFMDKLAQMRPNTGQAGGGLPGNYGQGGGRGYGGGNPRPDFGARMRSGTPGGGAPQAASAGPQMGKANEAAAAGAAPGGATKAPYGGAPGLPGGGAPSSNKGFGGGAPQPSWVSAPQPAPGGAASNIYNPQGQMASAAGMQQPVSMAGGAQPQSDGAAPAGGPQPQSDGPAPAGGQPQQQAAALAGQVSGAKGQPMPGDPKAQGGQQGGNPMDKMGLGGARGGAGRRGAPPQMAGGANLGGKTREDYTQAGGASGGI